MPLRALGVTYPVSRDRAAFRFLATQALVVVVGVLMAILGSVSMGSGVIHGCWMRSLRWSGDSLAHAQQITLAAASIEPGRLESWYCANGDVVDVTSAADIEPDRLVS